MTSSPPSEAIIDAFLEKLRSDARLPRDLVEAIARLTEEGRLGDPARLREAIEATMRTTVETEDP